MKRYTVFGRRDGPPLIARPKTHPTQMCRIGEWRPTEDRVVGVSGPLCPPLLGRPSDPSCGSVWNKTETGKVLKGESWCDHRELPTCSRPPRPDVYCSATLRFPSPPATLSENSWTFSVVVHTTIRVHSPFGLLRCLSSRPCHGAHSLLYPTSRSK